MFTVDFHILRQDWPEVVLYKCSPAILQLSLQIVFGYRLYHTVREVL